MNSSEQRLHVTTPVALVILLGMVLVGGVLASVMMTQLIGNGIVSINDRGGLLWLTALQDVLVFIAPAALTLWLLWKRPWHVARLDRAPAWRFIALAVAVQVVALPAMNWVVEWNNNVTFPPVVEHMLRAMEDAAAAQTELLLGATTLWQLLAGIAVIGVMAGVSEELLFRGAILGTWLEDRVKRHVAIWAVAVIFSAIHLQFYGFVPRMLLGAWLGYLMVWGRSLWVPIIAHGLNNSIVVIASWLETRGVIESGLADNIGLAPAGTFPWLATLSALMTVAVIVMASKRMATPHDTTTA